MPTLANRLLVGVLIATLTGLPLSAQQSLDFAPAAADRLIAFAKAHDRVLSQDEKEAAKEFKNIFRRRGEAFAKHGDAGANPLLQLQSIADQRYSGIQRQRAFVRRLVDVKKRPPQGAASLVHEPLTIRGVAGMALDLKNSEVVNRQKEVETAARFVMASRGLGGDSAILEEELQFYPKIQSDLQKHLLAVDVALKEMSAPSSEEIYSLQLDRLNEAARRESNRAAARALRLKIGTYLWVALGLVYVASRYAQESAYVDALEEVRAACKDAGGTYVPPLKQYGTPDCIGLK